MAEFKGQVVRRPVAQQGTAMDKLQLSVADWLIFGVEGTSTVWGGLFVIVYAITVAAATGQSPEPQVPAAEIGAFEAAFGRLDGSFEARWRAYIRDISRHE